MSALHFNSLLVDNGINPADVRLLRHETRRHGRTPYALWRDDPQLFEDYQRVQNRGRRAYFASPIWASFVVSPDGKTLFAGIYKPILKGTVPDDWVDPIAGRYGADWAEYDLYDAPLQLDLQAFAGRLAVDWGPGTRSWAQRASNSDKGIVELRDRLIEPPFPGLARFFAPLTDLETLPPGWKQVLRQAQGVYLLTCPETREQYVGSASGAEGFLSRWTTYANDGHGGNIALKSRNRQNYRASVLQVAGSADNPDTIREMESIWKEKLQSREMGLNRN